MKQLVLVIALCFGITSFAQNTKEGLEKATLDYFKTVESNDFDAMLDAMHPDVFKVFPRADMKKGMEQMLNNEQMELSFLSSNLKSVSELIEDNNSTYALVSYTNDMKMTFNETKTMNDAERDEFISFMKQTLEQQFGEGKVKVGEDKISVLAPVEGTLYGIYKADFKGWKFLGNEANMSTIINNIIPEKVRAVLEK